LHSIGVGQALILFVLGAIASAINAVAGGGSLITFPALTVAFHMPSNIANATNSVALWPGSMAGAIGFKNLLHKTKKYLKVLFVPTLVGSIVGAELFINTSTKVFDRVIPWLILLAAMLLLFQPTVKTFAVKHGRTTSPATGAILQFLVSVYGGYFGAGMGIMMLAAFALFMEGTIHELNAVKTWLGLVINFAASVMFLFQHIIDPSVAIVLTLGSIVGGFYAAKFSQKVNPDKMRLVIAAYGLIASAYFMYRTFRLPSWPELG
jgi:uncharacterized membrane protein YfcA